MDIKEIILKEINKKKVITASDIIKITNFSRTYVNNFFQELRNEGRIILVGKANRARYVIAEKNRVAEARKKILDIRKFLKNINLSEDTVLDNIKRDSGIFVGLDKNVDNIVHYAFTEILNNAIDHSMSEDIEVRIKRDKGNIRFDIIDHGIGIFNNIRQKKNLRNELEAIQDLLKGKQTTAPQAHSGEGIFFTSKAADSLVIESSNKKLFFNNLIDDIFIQNIKNFKGTKVIFIISEKTKRDLSEIFKEYSGESFEFNKTSVAVRLYKMGSLYISRSQARRVMNGLEKFKTVTLDFNHIITIGQSFADEIFRVWQNYHPGIGIVTINTNENTEFMIKRVSAQDNSRQLRLPRL